jgi:hypothetical protein
MAVSNFGSSTKAGRNTLFIVLFLLTQKNRSAQPQRHQTMSIAFDTHKRNDQAAQSVDCAGLRRSNAAPLISAVFDV